MGALDNILKKRDGGELSRQELRLLIEGYTKGDIPDYQMSAWLMAVYFKGMSRQEAGWLTREMLESGDLIDLRSSGGLEGPFVDKHSTGGVGDKVSLIVAPLVASLGVKVPMMSGRSLGHTGGTLDKLDAIPGYTTALDPQRFAAVIAEVGYAMTGQSERIVPADRKLYALRDVTGTVESIPLITASILSKKCAEGADALIFDVKCGSGAFMKRLEDARVLMQSLTETGRELGKGIVSVITRMEEPLGCMVGNFLEVEEVAACLQGFRPGYWSPEDSADLMAVSLRLASWMLIAAGVARGHEEATDKMRRALEDGSAWKTFLRNVECQDGDPDELMRRLGGWRAAHRVEFKAPRDGWVQGIDAYKIGMASVRLGAGRSKIDDRVLPRVGLWIGKKCGAQVRAGEPLCLLWGEEPQAIERALTEVQAAYRFADNPPDDLPESMILDEMNSL